MLKPGMYVRCPYDMESKDDPRVFVVGKILQIDEVSDLVKVKFFDPFNYRQYYDLLSASQIVFNTKNIGRCQFYPESKVLYNDCECRVISYRRNEKDSYYYYYLENLDETGIEKACETDIEAPFTSGRVDPAKQLQNYEFQNPCWYFGRTIVKRTTSILKNSIYGFSDLAGSKILLKPYQLQTIMRCLEGKQIRYMLADEVGLGKTIEALSTLKIFLKDKKDQIVLIAVPRTLVAQWRSELYLKFALSEGENLNGNLISIKAIEELSDEDIKTKYSFSLFDEIHKYIKDPEIYETLHSISNNSDNILALSATPVHQRGEEYLKLLRLIHPEKYDHLEYKDFEKLLEKQHKITVSANLVYTSIEEMAEEINDLGEENPHESEDCEEIFEEMYEELHNLEKLTHDEEFSNMISAIAFDSEDLGVSAAKSALSYLCENYQLENNVIRNRRQFQKDEYAKRVLHELPYSIEEDNNYEEGRAYTELNRWIASLKNGLTKQFTNETLHPLLGAFFSSPVAYFAEVKRQLKNGVEINKEVYDTAQIWVDHELSISDNLIDSIDDEESSRLISVLSFIEEQPAGSKFLLFSDHKETIEFYKEQLNKLFEPEEIVCFVSGMKQEELDQNVFRFQNGVDCHIMLSDQTGGEGRNLQSADYLIHVDLPWDANAIEQRIGRLDRIGRESSKPVVSVVPYADNSFEQQLFDYWNKGLHIFEQPLSGLEIIADEISETIEDAITEDFEYGIYNAIPEMIKNSEVMRSQVREEQAFDTAAYKYKPMNTVLEKLVEYYSENENALFAETMMNWAELAGFNGISLKKGSNLVEFSELSFSMRSASNSMLIPPDWNSYVNRKDLELAMRVQNGVEEKKEKNVVRNNRKITGTFDRKTAIEKDFIHFFAPGDEVFDCIVRNAMESTRGQVCAVALSTKFNWRGFVFTYSILPDEYKLLENGIPLSRLNSFRNYLSSAQIQIPITIGQLESGVTEQKVISQFNAYVNRGYFDSPISIDHLGRRGKKDTGFLDIPSHYNVSNIDWFRAMFKKDNWEILVAEARKSSLKRAQVQFYKLSRLKEAEDEIRRIKSVKKNVSKYYETQYDDSSDEHWDILLDCLKNARITLESASFVWMVSR